MGKDIKLVDCTLRDGGYYNNWDFNPLLIQDYLSAMEESVRISVNKYKN